MAVQWAIVANAQLPLDPAEKLPSFVPGMSAAAPSGSGITISPAETLVIAGESLDAVRAFCIANAGLTVTSSGSAPSVAIDRAAGLVRVLVTSRTDLTRKTPLQGNNLAAVSNTAGAAASSSMAGGASDSDA